MKRWRTGPLSEGAQANGMVPLRVLSLLGNQRRGPFPPPVEAPSGSKSEGSALLFAVNKPPLPTPTKQNSLPASRRHRRLC